MTVHERTYVDMEVLQQFEEALECYDYGNDSLAKEGFLRVLQMDPHFSMAYAYLSRIHRHKKDWKAAIALAHRGLLVDPESFVLQEEIRKAKLHRGQELLLYRKEGTVWIQLGRCQESLENWNEAIYCFQKSIGLDGSSIEVHESLAWVLEQAGYKEQARQERKLIRDHISE